MRLFLAGFYLVMMVLVPAVHVVNETTSDEAHQCACDATGEHQPKEDSSGSHQHSPDSCSVCQLLLVQIDSPDAAITTSFCELFEAAPPVAINVVSRQHLRCEQARAPPFKTA